MTWANSYVVSASIRDALGGTVALALAAGNANKKIALYDNTVVPSIDTSPQSYSVAPWNTGEVTGTAWAAGGVALSLTALGISLVSGVGVMFDAVDVSVASTTVSNAFGCLIYDNVLAPKAAVVAVYFGGTGYSTNNGTFGITWDANGVFRITLHP
jgi:hypothetical protein